MSFLRDIARAGPHPPRATPCLGCSNRIFNFERFCPCCGARNHGFDNQQFMALAKVDLHEARQVCTDFPSHDIEVTSYLLDPDLRALARRWAFCYICGAAFFVES